MPSKKPVIMTYTDKETVEKFKIIAKKENRSVSKQLLNMINKEIEEYENNNGKIQINNINIETNNGEINIKNSEN